MDVRTVGSKWGRAKSGGCVAGQEDSGKAALGQEASGDSLGECPSPASRWH